MMKVKEEVIQRNYIKTQ